MYMEQLVYGSLIEYGHDRLVTIVKKMKGKMKIFKVDAHLQSYCIYTCIILYCIHIVYMYI